MKQTNEEFIAALKANPAYSHIDIDIEINRAAAWCMANNRQNTPRFFVNWINRIQRPLAPRFASDVPREMPPVQPDPVCDICGKDGCLMLHREERGI